MKYTHEYTLPNTENNKSVRDLLLSLFMFFVLVFLPDIYIISIFSMILMGLELILSIKLDFPITNIFQSPILLYTFNFMLVAKLMEYLSKGLYRMTYRTYIMHALMVLYFSI
jgi:hypothetical protein